MAYSVDVWGFMGDICGLGDIWCFGGAVIRGLCRGVVVGFHVAKCGNIRIVVILAERFGDDVIADGICGGVYGDSFGDGG